MKVWNRRDFLQQSMGATLLAGMSPLAFASGKLSPLNKKSLKFGMIKGNMSVLEKFMLVKELGFDGIELDAPNDLDDDEVLEAKEKTGLEIPGVVNSVHWKSPLSSPDASVRKTCSDSMVHAISLCKKYGGTTVLLVPAVVNEEISYADAWDRSVAEIKKFLPVAEEEGINIALENVWNNFLLSPLEAVRYVDQFESDSIGWYMDIGNIVRYGWPEQWIHTLGKRIMKVDVKEYSRKKQQEEGIWKGFDVKLGDGDSNWAEVNKALSDIGYSGWGSAEVSGGDRERLKEISERMDKIYAL